MSKSNYFVKPVVVFVIKICSLSVSTGGSVEVVRRPGGQVFGTFSHNFGSFSVKLMTQEVSIVSKVHLWNTQRCQKRV